MVQRLIIHVKDKRGALLWELLIVLAILFTFLYSTVSFFTVFFQYETMTYAAKTVARQVEVTGRYNNIQDDFANLCPNLENKSVSISVDYSTGVATDGSLATSLINQKKIQLSQKFTMTYNATYQLQLFGQRNGNVVDSWTIPVRLSYKVTGMSEVYWRE